MDTILLAVGAAMGAAIAYIDSRPTWDDTGITVAALLAASALLGMISPRRPWKWGLAVGIWLPAYEIFLNHNYSMVLVLLIPMIGAYAGAGANWMIRKALRPA